MMATISPLYCSRIFVSTKSRVNIDNFQTKIGYPIDFKLKYQLIRPENNIICLNLSQLKASDEDLPVQLLPSPEYPTLHLHVYDPGVLLQIALMSQL